MYIKDGKRFNINRDLSGTGIDKNNLAASGITEIPDPERKDDRFYYVTEQDTEPYVVNTRKPKEQIVSMLWEQVKSLRDFKSEQGCKVGDKWYHNDVKSRTQWERMANKSDGLQPTDIYTVGGQQVVWKTMDGTFQPLTAGTIASVVAAFELQEALMFTHAESLKVALNASDTPEEVDIQSGWPETYPPVVVETP